MKKNYTLIYVILTILLINFVHATYDLTVPNYLDVNVSETLRLDGYEDQGNNTAYLLLNGLMYNFWKDTTYFEIAVTGTTEDDVPVHIFVSNVSPEYYNFSDANENINQTITDQTRYGVYKYETSTHYQNYTEQNIICIKLKNSKGTPIISPIIYHLKTNVSEVFNFPTYSVTNTAYATMCYHADYTYLQTLTNYTEYFGFYCTNCGASNQITLAQDTNTTYPNASFTSINISTITNLTGKNNIISVYDYDISPVWEGESLLKFRIPYYTTITLYNKKNESLQTQFDYVYLQTGNTPTSYSKIGSALTSGFLGIIGGSSLPVNVDYTETFWGKVTGDTATIKLYETGTYQVTLLTMKTFMNGWNYEFIKPQYTRSAVETRLDNALTFNNKNNTQVNILMSEYEANKSDFIFNILKWIFIAVIFILGIVVSFSSPAPLYGIGGIFLIILILIKLLGVHI